MNGVTTEISFRDPRLHVFAQLLTVEREISVEDAVQVIHWLAELDALRALVDRLAAASAAAVRLRLIVEASGEVSDETVQ